MMSLLGGAFSPCLAQQMRGNPPLLSLGEPSASATEVAATSEAAPAIAESPENADATGDTPASAGGGQEGGNGEGASAGGAGGDPPLRIPYSSVFSGMDGGPIGSNVFRGTGGPLGGFGRGLTPPSVLSEQVKNGEGHAKFSLGLPGLRARLPSLSNINVPFLHRRFSPEKAHLKMGPVYVRFGELSGALLASDNVNLEQTNRDAGCISVVRLGMTVMAQLTEGLQFAVAGTLDRKSVV